MYEMRTALKAVDWSPISMRGWLVARTSVAFALPTMPPMPRRVDPMECRLGEISARPATAASCSARNGSRSVASGCCRSSTA